MSSSNAAVARPLESTSSEKRNKPTLKSVENTKVKTANLPTLSHAEAVRDAILRTG